MTTVVVDGNNLAQILAEAEIGIVPDVPDPRTTNLTKVVEQTKEEPKAELKADKADAKVDESDDVEGEDGLTPRQKREFTDSMLKSLAKKHAKQKSAEEFATNQYNTRLLAEQKAKELAEENERLRKAQIRVEPVKEAAEPKREDFKTDDEYLDAKIDWRADQKFKAQQAAEQLKQAQQRQAEIVQSAIARIDHAKEIVSDFTEVTQACDWETPPYIASYMQESEMFAELGYFLALPAQADVRTKLSKMRPEAALVEIGKIESKLSPFVKSDKTETKVKDGNGSDKPSPNGAKPSPEALASETGKTPSRSRAAVITPLSSGSANQVEREPANAQEALEAWQKKRGIDLTRRQRH